MEKTNKYTVKEFLKYFKRNNILLVDGDSIGDIELPEVDPQFIKDNNEDKTIKS